MLHRAGIEGRHAAELLGPGDLLRPWQYLDGADSTLDVEWTWRMVAPARCAVLDSRWRARAAQGRSSAWSSPSAHSGARCGS